MGHRPGHFFRTRCHLVLHAPSEGVTGPGDNSTNLDVRAARCTATDIAGYAISTTACSHAIAQHSLHQPHRRPSNLSFTLFASSKAKEKK